MNAVTYLHPPSTTASSVGTPEVSCPFPPAAASGGGLRDVETRSLRLVLGEGAIRGRVTRGPGAAGVPGILVSASGPAWNMTRTGADGSFAFEGAASGRYAIQAIVRKGDVRTAEVEVPAAGDAPEVEIRLEP